MKMLLNASCSASLPSASVTTSVEISLMRFFDTSSVTLDQMSTTLLYFSPMVISPSLY